MVEKRNFHGYLQTRERPDKWQFHVTGFDGTFSGSAGFCTVLRAGDDAERDIPIDTKDRILIRGKWYGKDHWTH